MDLSQFSTEALQAMKQKKQLLTDVVGGAIDKAKEAIVQQPEITNKSREAWLEGLNPNDYQTALNADEVQRFSDWAKATNAPISQGYDMQGYWKDNIAPFDALKGKYTEEQIAGARQGLNGGNVDLAKFIEQNNIRRPGTPSEIALAKQGKFNPVGEFTHAYDTPWSDTYSTDSKYATGDNAKYAGTFKDGNYTSAVDQATKDGILQQVMSGFENYGDTDKTGWNKVGKGLDIARAVASNPLLQGAVAGAISAKTTGDVGKGIQTGVNWAQDKAKSNFYARQLGQKPGVFGNYDAKDYTAKANADYNKEKNNIYLTNVMSQVQHRLEQEKLSWADLERKIKHDEFTEDMAQKKFGLSLRQLEDTIRHRKEMERQGRERIGISRSNLSQKQKEFEWKKKNGGKGSKPMTYNQYISSRNTLNNMLANAKDEDEVNEIKEMISTLNTEYNSGKDVTLDVAEFDEED